MGTVFCSHQSANIDTRFINILFIGDSGVGKTSMIRQICYGTYDPLQPPTQCQESYTYQFAPHVKLVMKDNGGADRFKSCLSPSAVAKADAIVYVYSQSDPDSLRSAMAWQKRIKSLQTDSPFHQPKQYLIANKADKSEKMSDLTRTMLEGEYLNFRHSFSTSSWEAENLKQILDIIVEDIQNIYEYKLSQYEEVILQEVKDDRSCGSHTTTDEDLINFINS